MARAQTVFTCSTCGATAAKWHGQCPSCGDWNTLVEEAAPARTAGGRAGGGAEASPAKAPPLRDVKAEATVRLKTGIGELDRVLGGGIVPGSVVLLGGSPGIGKSTPTGMAPANLAGAGRRRVTAH